MRSNSSRVRFIHFRTNTLAKSVNPFLSPLSNGINSRPYWALQPKSMRITAEFKTAWVWSKQLHLLNALVPTETTASMFSTLRDVVRYFSVESPGFERLTSLSISSDIFLRFCYSRFWFLFFLLMAILLLIKKESESLLFAKVSSVFLCKVTLRVLLVPYNLVLPVSRSGDRRLNLYQQQALLVTKVARYRAGLIPRPVKGWTNILVGLTAI